jgi:hypothetical protein
VLSSYVLSGSDLRQDAQRTLHAHGYRTMRVGAMNGRAIVVEHPSEDGDRVDTLLGSIDPGAYRIRPDAPKDPEVARRMRPRLEKPELSRWRSVW